MIGVAEVRRERARRVGRLRSRVLSIVRSEDSFGNDSMARDTDPRFDLNP